MSGRPTVLAFVLAIGGAPALAVAQDHAVPRGGGGSTSSSAGEHHSGGASSSSAGSGSSSSSSSSGGSDSSGPTTDAQRRHPRPGTGTGGYGGGYYPGGYYYSPYYYGYDPFYYGYYYAPFYYGGSYGYSPTYYSSHYGDSGSLRVIVDPEKTRVYVDNYYAGIADDFDGIFQRLHVPPGRHEISLKLDGYRTHKFRVYVPPGETIKLHYAMERGTGEDPEETVGTPPPDNYDRYNRPEDRDDRYGDREAPSAPPGAEPREDERDDAEAATLHLSLRPPDASVYVDGEFRGSGRRAEVLRLAPGRHHIEVVRPGYRTVERDVDLRPGDRQTLDIDLSR